MPFGQGDGGELVKDGPDDEGFQAMPDRDARTGAMFAMGYCERMLRTEDDGVAAIQLERDLPLFAIVFASHRDRAEGGRFHFDRQFLDGRYQDMAAVRLPSQHGRKKPNHLGPADRRSHVKPGAVGGDPHFAVTAMVGVPLVDRRQAFPVDRLGKLGERAAGDMNWRAALGHGLGSCHPTPPGAIRAAMTRTAIVTGAGKRIGRVIAEALIADGWTVIAHVRRQGDAVPEGAIKAVAELGGADCAERIFAAAHDVPAPTLLVNNAARFAEDGVGNFSPQEFSAHMASNVQAPVLLTEAFVAAGGEGDRLVVNLLDSKLGAPNPDYLSYTLSKMALAGFTEIAAKAHAGRHVRVNGIAPALMLRSPGQSEENFRAMHRHNPLGRGVDPEDVVAALRYFIGAPAVTGQILTIDGGQRFWALPRDVQFLEQ